MKRKQVGLFFIEDSKSGTGIKSLKDLKVWLKSFPELGVIASVTPFFIALKNQSISQRTTSPDFWEKLALEIRESLKQLDGFVVFHPLETAAFTGSVLSYMFSPLQKPIVFTGSPASYASSDQKDSSRKSPAKGWADLASRANIMNAAQVATMDVADVLILSGNRLIRANRAERSSGQSLHAFETDEEGLVGRIDFSIHLFPRKTARKKSGTKSFQLEKQIAVIDLHKEFDFSILPMLAHGKKGILMQSPNTVDAASVLRGAVENLPEDIPIVLHVQKPEGLNALDIEKITPSRTLSFEAALTKLMYALGQKRASHKSVKEIFSRDIAGEYVEAGKGGGV